MPTTAGIHKDIEAAYQFLKAVKQTPDEEITGYGYCLSGQIMAELAKRHPYINLYLDRTFSSLYELVLREGEKIVDRFFRRREKRSEEENLLIARFIRAVVTPFVWMLAPAYSVLPSLKTIKGRVHVMDAEGDLTVPKEDAAVMQAEMKKAHKEALFSHATLPKTDRPHFTQWYQISVTRFKPPKATRGLGIGEGMIPDLVEYPGVDQVEGFFKGLRQLRPILSSSSTA